MSSSISTGPKCPRCAADLPADAVAGLCPRCLMAGVMAPTGESSTPMPAPAPAELAAHFPQLEIIEFLGRGGMGIVYKARQKALGRLVALKLLAPERVEDPQFAERFEKEAKALAALGHPNIVTIHDFGQAGGFFYLLMEFVDGVNLRQAMKAGRFLPEQALAIVPPICEALQYAHEQGIVHRDIKPENLLLDKRGRVKIADFGIAKIMGAESSGVELFESQPAGTPQYMAPEQKEQGVTDHRADIYSLGVVLYEMLTGELPAGKLQAPSKRVQVDVRIDEIVLRALQVEPELRFATALEFKTKVETIAGALERPAAAQSSQASSSAAGGSSSSATADPGNKRPPRKPIFWVAAAILGVLILAPVILGAAYLLTQREAPPSLSGLDYVELKFENIIVEDRFVMAEISGSATNLNGTLEVFYLGNPVPLGDSEVSKIKRPNLLVLPRSDAEQQTHGAMIFHSYSGGSGKASVRLVFPLPDSALANEVALQLRELAGGVTRRLTSGSTMKLFDLAREQGRFYAWLKFTTAVETSDIRAFRPPVNDTAGIGVALKVEGGRILIGSVLPGSPAEKDGRLKPGHEVREIGESGDQLVSIAGWKLEDVVARLRGKEGTQVSLFILKEGDGTIVTLMRRHLSELESEHPKTELPLSNPSSIKPAPSQ